MLSRALMVFAAGCLGGLTAMLALWLSGAIGLSAALGVAITLPLTPELLYRPIVWGGLWGFLFLLPLLPGKPWLRGLVFSLGPTLGQLLVVFPLKTEAGLLGLGLGTLTPLLVLLVNATWGLAAAGLLQAAGAERSAVGGRTSPA